MPTRRSNALFSNQQLENARTKYLAAVNIFISECQIIWSRYNAMLVFNTLLVSGIGFISINKVNVPLIPVLLPILGLFSCYVWYATADRGFRWIDYWISAANELENEYFRDDNDLLNPILRGAMHKKLIPHPTTPTLSLILIKCIALIYLLILLFMTINFINSTILTTFNNHRRYFIIEANR